MKRRNFIKSMGALGAVVAAPSIFQNEYFIKQARAAAAINEANFVPPARLPQVINIFLYGGPSELAGNLTNIDDINANSQNPYNSDNGGAGGGILLTTQEDPTNGQITQNGFWKDAGGSIMEELMAGTGLGGAGEEMLSVYRTINRRKENTRAHRPSILSSQKGNLDIEMSGGVGTTLASVLYANKGMIDGTALLGGRPLEELVLPFVSFEGESSAFAPDSSTGSVNLPLQLRGISMDQRFRNPYTRDRGIGDPTAIDNIVNMVSAANVARYQKVADGFTNRAALQSKIANFSDAVDQNNAATYLPNVGVGDPDADAAGVLQYPNNNNFSDRVQAAVTLAMMNPDSLYISVGGGLGGWDDHDNAIEKYENRMTDLMSVLRVAAKHLKFGQRFTFDANGNSVPLLDGGGNPVTGDNIIINVHGDFGRNVNLNGSMGWDHGNNQNLYTLGGSAIRGQAALGKVVGATERFGDSGQNRQFTRPTSSSYEAEPMSIASTVYSYFGVQNPEVLTKDADMNPGGDPAIDETVAGEAPLF